MRRFGPQRGHRGSEQADVAFANVSHESPDNIITEKDASRVGVYSFALLMFAAGFAAVFVLSSPWLSVFTVLGSAAAGLLLASTLRVAAQWEHVALLRFGRFRKIAGPGVYVVVPFVDSVAMHIDRRTITTAFYAEQALTSDLVSVDVDAILFWMVYDSEKACLEVANFPQAVRRAAQTAVRCSADSSVSIPPSVSAARWNFLWTSFARILNSCSMASLQYFSSCNLLSRHFVPSGVV